MMGIRITWFFVFNGSFQLHLLAADNKDPASFGDMRVATQPARTVYVTCCWQSCSIAPKTPEKAPVTMERHLKKCWIFLLT